MGQLPLDLDSGRLLDGEARTIAAKAEDPGTRFGYERPDDQFRQSYMQDFTLKAHFPVEAVCQ
ncbi:hypothetical protein D3C81_2115620 [compost metagenome]